MDESSVTLMFPKIFKHTKSGNFSTHAIKKEGSAFEVDCWALSDLLLNRIIPKIGTRPYPLNEQMLMVGAVAFIQPKLIIEWGTHLGKSARLFWEAKEALGIDCSIHTVDSMEPDHPEFPGNARGKYLSNTDVNQSVGDGASVAGKLIEQADGPILLFVDGDHSREATKKDLSLWESLPPGSGLLAHDVFYQEPSPYNIGPWESFQELLQISESSIAGIQWQMLGLPGLAFIGKK